MISGRMPSDTARIAPAFPGATLALDGGGQIVHTWLGTAAPAIDPHADVIAALGIDEGSPDAARLQILLASAVGAVAEDWPLLATEAPRTLRRRDGTLLPVMWNPIVDAGVISWVALFVLSAAPAPVATEDPIESNRRCVDALALLDECDASLHQLQADRHARAVVHRLFRAVHTIKGSLGGPRFQPIVELAHRTEDAIEILRRDDDAPPELVGQIADALRELRAQVIAARPRGELDDAMTELVRECRPVLVELQLGLARLADGDREAAAIAGRAIERIRAASERANLKSLLAQCTVAANAAEALSYSGDADPARIAEIATLDRQIELYAAVHREAFALDTGPALLLLIASWMDTPDDPSALFAGFVEVLSQCGLPSLVEVFTDPDPVAVRCATALLLDAAAMFEPSHPRDDATLRFERAQRDLRDALDGLARTVPRAELAALHAVIERLAWVPLATVTRRLVHLTRTLGVELGKDIRIEIELGDVLVAPDIARVLGELLIHALRNAVDHGIEPPADRVAAGKPPRGTITVAAYPIGDRIHVAVSDDGGGVALDRVRRIAVARGLLAADAAAAATTPELLELLFHPGFSTAAQATSVSGRGVGMDVIRTLVEDCGGSVTLSSTLGRGSELNIDLPVAPRVHPAG